MEDYTPHLRQLPNFLQAEIAADLGPLHGFSYLQIISRYKAVIDWVMSKKRAVYVYHPNASGLFEEKLLAPAELEVAKFLADGHAARGGAFYLGLQSRVVSASIEALTIASNALGGILIRAEAAARQVAQQQAAEAARIQAQRQAEETARQLAIRQAEEAARQLAQRQAEEAARQLAQRQAEAAARQRAEEAARLEAQRIAEDAARVRAQQLAEKTAFMTTLLRVKPVAIEIVVNRAKAVAIKEAGYTEINAALAKASDNSVPWVLGPKAIAEIEQVTLTLKSNLETAVIDFAEKVNQDMGITSADALNAMLGALALTSKDIQAA